jgi:dTMP kinase
MLLYMAARAQLVEEVIRPALDRGDTVLSDRFLLANVVYQGYGGGLEVESLWEIGRVATAGVMPELTIVLDIAPAVAAARLARSLDRMERQGDEFHQRVRQGFLAEAARQPDRIVVVDAAPAAEEVHAAVRAAVERFLQTRHPPCVLPPNKPAKPAR